MHGAPGSGGSVLIHAGVIYSYSSSILATGGSGPSNQWNPTATGGVGRVAIYYKSLGNSLTGISPAPYTSTDVIPPFLISGTITDPADIFVFREEDGFYLEKIAASQSGAYSFYVADDTYYMLIAKPTDINKAASVYTRVRPIAT
jgi:hypothetical protein